jgi:transcriptional regulator with XRE-family HTH domain
METSITQDLLAKIEEIAQGPNADLLRRLVEILYNQEEEYFSTEDLAEIERGEEEIRRGEHISLEEYERTRGL